MRKTRASLVSLSIIAVVLVGCSGEDDPNGNSGTGVGVQNGGAGGKDSGLGIEGRAGKAGTAGVGTGGKAGAAGKAGSAGQAGNAGAAGKAGASPGGAAGAANAGAGGEPAMAGQAGTGGAAGAASGAAGAAGAAGSSGAGGGAGASLGGSSGAAGDAGAAGAAGAAGVAGAAGDAGASGAAGDAGAGGAAGDAGAGGAAGDAGAGGDAGAAGDGGAGGDAGAAGVAGAGGAGGDAGAAGAGGATVPPPDGNFCNTLTPPRPVASTFLVTSVADVPSVGPNGGCLVDRFCEEGEAVVGVIGRRANNFYNDALTEVHLECGVVNESGGTVTIGPPALVTPNAGYWVPSSGLPYSVRCPTDTVVVGVRIDRSLPTTNGNAYITHIELTCAHLAYVGGQLVVGAIEQGSPSVPAALPPPNGVWGSASCEANQIVAGGKLYAGEVYEGFGPRCVTLQKQ